MRIPTLMPFRPPFPWKTLVPWMIWLACIAPCCPAQHPAGEESGDDIQAAESLIQNGAFSDARDLLGRAREHLQGNPEDGASNKQKLFRVFVRLARAEQLAGQTESASQSWKQTLACLTLPSISISPAQEEQIRLAAGQCFCETQKVADAVASLEPLLRPSTTSQPVEPSEPSKMAQKLLLRLGSRCYKRGDLQSAAKAWTPVSKLSDSEMAATAELGLVWVALAEHNEPIDSIAEKMVRFADSHPKHPDAKTVLEECIRQLAGADRLVLVDDTYAKYVDHCRQQTATVDPKIAGDIANAHQRSVLAGEAPFEMPAVAGWLTEPNTERMPYPSVSYLAAVGTRTSSRSRFEFALGALARAPHGKGEFDRLFKHVDGSEIAPWILSHLDDSNILAHAKLRSARWYAQKQRWSDLATILEGMEPSSVLLKHHHAELPPDGSNNQEKQAANTQSNLSQRIQLGRCLAESLTRSGKTKEAMRWWKVVVDELNDKAFVSTLRLAESCVAHAELSEANRRLDAAILAAADDRHFLALVHLLQANAYIRSVRFDDARENLERVVRNPEATREVRARAQWLLGETHFLQQDFSSAIDAYRLVEGIAPESEWAAASLLQAGKAFEELGRTPAASICYGNLMARFADSPHAGSARQRIARLNVNESDHRDPAPSAQILRR